MKSPFFVCRHLVNRVRSLKCHEVASKRKHSFAQFDLGPARERATVDDEEVRAVREVQPLPSGIDIVGVSDAKLKNDD